jgi:outer membrane protein
MTRPIDTALRWTRCLLLIVALTSPAFAQSGKRPPPSPPPSGEKTPVEPPQPISARTGKEISISAADAVRSALNHNPAIVQRQLDVAIAAEEIVRQQGLFRPTLATQVSYRQFGQYTSNRDAPTVTARAAVVNSALTGRTGLGGTYSLNVRGESGYSLFFPNLLPNFQTGVFGRYTQPLLRDGGATPNRGLVERAELAHAATKVEYDDRRLRLAIEVVESYWRLVVRWEEVKIREANLSEARNLRELIERRIKGGQAPRSDAIQADVTVAERQQAVRQAMRAVVDAERELLGLTFLSRSEQFQWEHVIVPSERPAEQPTTLVFTEQLEIALRERPEVQRVERELQLARLDRAIADNASKARLDLYAEAGLLGLAGLSTIPAGEPGAPAVILRGGLGQAVGNMVGVEAPFFEVGVQLEIPLGNDLRAAAARQAKLRVDRILADDVRTGIALDVRAAMQSLEIARSRLDGAKSAQVLASQNVESMRKRYDGGAATVFDTLRAQDELARAQAEVVLAAAEQEVALVLVIAARGTLLEHFGIVANS